MVKACRLVLLFASVAAGQSAPVQGAEPTALLREWAALNSACRGGSGDDPKTMQACARRDTLDRRLAAEGWCYGRPGDLGYQRRWQPCADTPRQ